jgi:hypothetical protein
MSYPRNFDADEYQAKQDQDHLNLLSIFHYVMGGLATLSALGVGAYFSFMGLIFSSAASSASSRPGSEPPPAFFGGFMVLMGVLSFLAVAGRGGTELPAYAAGHRTGDFHVCGSQSAFGQSAV